MFCELFLPFMTSSVASVNTLPCAFAVPSQHACVMWLVITNPFCLYEVGHATCICHQLEGS